jgi:hypothetical protein
VQDNSCDLCNREPETTLHLLFRCPFAASFWRALGIELPPGLDIHDVHKIPRPDTIPAAHFDAFILLCCWHLWKRRNGITLDRKQCRCAKRCRPAGAMRNCGAVVYCVLSDISETSGVPCFLWQCKLICKM